MCGIQASVASELHLHIQGTLETRTFSPEEWRFRAEASRALVGILALLELRVRRLVKILKVKFILYLACPGESNLLGFDLLLVLTSLQQHI